MRLTQTDLAPDRRPALELRLLERGEYVRLATAYEAGAESIQCDHKLSARQKLRRWHDQMASAAVLRGRM